MILRRSLLLLPILLLAACAGWQAGDDDPTLEQLAQRAAKIEPVTLPPLSRNDVRHTYETLARNTGNESLRAMALQRLADLELENTQTKLAGEAPQPDTTNASTTGADAAGTDTIRNSAPVAEPPVRESIAGLVEDTDEQPAIDAIRQYERLLELYPDYAGNDRVLYQLARAYELDGNLNKALEVLTRLIETYPQQINRDEIQFRRGEILFSSREFEQAERAYQDVLGQGETRSFYGRALFKHGWAVFKQGDTQRALPSYFAVLDRSFAGGRDSADFSRSELEVLEDTLRVVSLSFSYLNGADSITEFFREYGTRKYEFRIYESLGELYLTQGRTPDAAETFFAFVERYPQHQQSPLFMVRMIDIYKQAGRAKQLLRAKADLINGYGIGTEFWRQHDEPLQAQLRPHIQKNLDDLSRYYHAQAQKQDESKDYLIAAHWYRLYVQSFPKQPETSAKHMLLAESLQDAGDLMEAAIEFEHTAYAYPLHKNSVEAGYAALLAQRKRVEGLEGAAKAKQQHAVIVTGKRFVASFAHDKRAVPVMSKAAEELLALKDYPQAVGTAHYVVSSQPAPEPELQRINWSIIAEGEFALGLYREAEQASLARLRITPRDDKDHDLYVERLAAAVYKQGELARTGGDQREAARHFLRLGKLAPTAVIRANAQYDAAASLVAMKDWTPAIPILEDFIRQYPNHKLRSEADETLALAHQSIGDWRRAADSLDVLYRNETDSNKKRLLLWQTAELYDKAKRPDDALEVYKRYVRAFPRPFDEAIEARFRLADIYQQRQQTPARHYWLGKIIEADKEGTSTDRSRFLAATAALELAEPKYETYRKIRLVQPLKKNLKKKKQFMQESIKAYTEAANYDVEVVTTASTFRIAEIYTDFSRELFDSERPKGLSAEELEQYDLLLEEQAYPFEEKAIEVHEVNVHRALEGIYDQWVKKSFSALTKLSPVRYAKMEKSEVVSRAID